MPSDGPTQWTTTLREHGRLVVGPERTRLTLSLVVSGGILLVNGTRTVGHLSSGADWDFFAYLRTILAVGAAIALLMILNNLRTRRWTLVVDGTGVTLGPQHLVWSEITGVTSAKEQVTVQGTEDLRITNNTVRDPSALALWLTTELETRH
ncbi:hypothetical protein [Kribbella italica]|uniref:PH domain-containing protein n=1 Tax=Kribbella italica TaxID=1540520 RepID=A0A7W9JFB4_9ACTN|nr:hypothetical protein [Kribbella italica]MBB5840745.1 hypothetical protein [Kribbella italica]